MPLVLQDITDGEKARHDPDLMRKARPDEWDVIRILYQVASKLT